MFSALRLLLVILWLFVTTTVTIKMTLPSASRRLTRHDAMIPRVEDVNATSLEEGISTQAEETPQEGSSSPPITTVDEQRVLSSLPSQLAHGVTIAQGKLVETWKVCSYVSSSKNNEFV